MAFGVSFLWFVLMSFGLLNWIPLPPIPQFLIEVFLAVAACFAFLYPTALFQNRKPAVRAAALCLIGVAIVAGALALLAICTIVRFAIRAAAGG